MVRIHVSLLLGGHFSLSLMAGATTKVHHEMSTNVEFDEFICILDVLQTPQRVGDRIQLNLNAILNIICTHALQSPPRRWNTLFVTVMYEGISLEPVH
jgi:hypothetical protein